MSSVESAMARTGTPRIVVDSSVAFKWIDSEREAHVGEARALLDDHLDGSLILAAPSHMLLEVLNAARMRRASESLLMRLTHSLLDLRLEWHDVTGLAPKAAVLAARHGITLYDAAFAALSVHLGVELITADRRLAESNACQARLLGRAGTSLE